MVSALVEIRAEGEHLHGQIVQEGRAASGGRAEVFAPNSITWPTDGVRILDKHGGPELARAYPHRDPAGRILIRARATDAIRAAIAAGRNRMSIEFRPIEERTTKGGVREILRALVDAAALVSNPEYDTTAAEVRERRRKGRRTPIWL